MTWKRGICDPSQGSNIYLISTNKNLSGKREADQEMSLKGY